MRLEGLLGRRVRYRGEEGRVVGGHADEEASVVLRITARAGSPSHLLTVPEPEWEQLELLR